MLTALRPFEGESISDVLASVLKTHPNWRTLPVDTPSALEQLLRRCLEKDPKRRLQAIGDARVQIEDLLSGAIEESSPAIVSHRARNALPWLVAGAVSFGLLLMLMLWAPWRTLPSPALMRLSV